MNHGMLMNRSRWTETLETRFWSKVDFDVNNRRRCWPWQAFCNPKGYGRFTIKTSSGERVTTYAHRVAYEIEVGEIPAGLQLDHLCSNKGCVNPWHLEPVTAKENRRRIYRQREDPS